MPLIRIRSIAKEVSGRYRSAKAGRSCARRRGDGSFLRSGCCGRCRSGWSTAVHAAVLPRPAARRAGRPAGGAVARRRAHRRGRARRAIPTSSATRSRSRVFMNVFNVHSNRRPVDGDGEAALVPRRQLPQRRARQGVARERAQRAAGCGPRDGADVTCVQIAGLIARRILCYVDAGRRARAGPALRLHPLRLARRRVPAAGRRGQGRARRQGLRHGIGPCEAQGAWVSWTSSKTCRAGRARRGAGAPRPRRAAPARHLPAAEPVHHRRAVRRLLRHRAGDEQRASSRRRSRSSSPWCSTAWTAASRA